MMCKSSRLTLLIVKSTDRPTCPHSDDEQSIDIGTNNPQSVSLNKMLHRPSVTTVVGYVEKKHTITIDRTL